MAVKKTDPKFTISAKWHEVGKGKIDYLVELKEGEVPTKSWKGKDQSAFEMRVALEKAAVSLKHAVKRIHT